MPRAGPFRQGATCRRAPGEAYGRMLKVSKGSDWNDRTDCFHIHLERSDEHPDSRRIVMFASIFFRQSYYKSFRHTSSIDPIDLGPEYLIFTMLIFHMIQN